jgi:IS30 family transposase
MDECLYLQARGALRTAWTIAVRQGRTCRVTRGHPAVTRGKIRDMVTISQRPAEAEDRAVPGFWEGNLMVGNGTTSQIATLVERTTRFVLLVNIPYDRTAERVAALLAKNMQTLPEVLRHSVTWDHGKEWPGTRTARSHQACPSTSATHTRPGNAAATKTPTVCSVSTFSQAPTCPCIPRLTFIEPLQN